MSELHELSAVINRSFSDQRNVFRDRFAQAEPFRHVVIDNFFNPPFCAALLDQFPAFDVKGAINENGEIGAKACREKVRELGPAFRQLDDLVQSPGFLSTIEDLTGIKGLRYDPHYFGGGTHENRQGQDLDPHIDFNYHPLTRQHRRLNLIVYLNEVWEDAWGGSLQLHRNPYLVPKDDDIITLTPLLNRCVIFETNEYSWHGFERIQLPSEYQHLSRKSFALYFYSDTRPAAETAAEHSTVYVDRHLPERFAAGLTLSQEDVQQIRVLLTRRDQHLQRLYRTVQHLSGQIAGLRIAEFSASSAGKVLMEKLTQNGANAELMLGLLMLQINALEQSTSWRITAPLRALKRLLTGRG